MSSHSLLFGELVLYKLKQVVVLGRGRYSCVVLKVFIEIFAQDDICNYPIVSNIDLKYRSYVINRLLTSYGVECNSKKTQKN